jgi:hypothetical protein
MGVDVGVKFRFLDDANNVKLEVEVTEQDNSLGSLLTESSEIQYTSLSLNDEKYLSQEEVEKIKLHYDESDEMVMSSKICEIPEVLTLFKKINRFTYSRISQSLINDIDNIRENQIEPEDKLKRIRNKISDYTDFKYSLGVSIGILQFGLKLYPKVQIVGEYY